MASKWVEWYDLWARDHWAEAMQCHHWMWSCCMVVKILPKHIVILADSLDHIDHVHPLLLLSGSTQSLEHNVQQTTHNDRLLTFHHNKIGHKSTIAPSMDIYSLPSLFHCRQKKTSKTWVNIEIVKEFGISSPNDAWFIVNLSTSYGIFYKNGKYYRNFFDFFCWNSMEFLLSNLRHLHGIGGVSCVGPFELLGIPFKPIKFISVEVNWAMPPPADAIGFDVTAFVVFSSIFPTK